jgi:hypothetical protein
MSVYVGEPTSNYYEIKQGYATIACIWVCFSCGEMFDSELCWSYTGECYECYPRPDKMKVQE